MLKGHSLGLHIERFGLTAYYFVRVIRRSTSSSQNLAILPVGLALVSHTSVKNILTLFWDV